MWAAGDLAGTPFQTLHLFAALTSLTALLSLALLLGQTLSATCDRLMAQTPEIVVRRINAGGWAPLPAVQALEQVKSVPGVINPRVRLWGVVESETGPVTAVAYPLRSDQDLMIPVPRPGQAVIGPGVAAGREPEGLILQGRQKVRLTVVARMPKAASMAAHDLVLVHPDDARVLLGLMPGQASDLALDVFHQEEVGALCAELSSVFPWPVHISTRLEQQRRCRSDIAQRTSLALLAAVPALLALAFVVSGVSFWGRNQRYQTGLLKSLGWTNADLLRLAVARAVLIGLPAVACGSLCAYLMLFWPGITWVTERLYGWPVAATALYLHPVKGAAGLLLGALLTGGPYLLSMIWSAWRNIQADPAQMLQEAGL